MQDVVDRLPKPDKSRVVSLRLHAPTSDDLLADCERKATLALLCGAYCRGLDVVMAATLLLCATRLSEQPNIRAEAPLGHLVPVTSVHRSEPPAPMGHADGLDLRQTMPPRRAPGPFRAAPMSRADMDMRAEVGDRRGTRAAGSGRWGRAVPPTRLAASSALLDQVQEQGPPLVGGPPGRVGVQPGDRVHVVDRVGAGGTGGRSWGRGCACNNKTWRSQR